MPRFFIIEQPENGVLTLRGEAAHHAGRVLRLRVGEAVTLCNGAGVDHDCVVQSVEKDAVVCRVQDTHPTRTEPRQYLSLYMGLPKGDKMELVVQKAVELGVREIIPFQSQNSMVKAEWAEKKALRWQKIATEAAGQCGRGYLPDVLPAVSFDEAVQRATTSETALFFYENETETGLRAALEEGVGGTVSLLIGPEGGFAPAEAETARAAGLRSVSLGTRILRCETAPIAALAAVLYAGGNM